SGSPASQGLGLGAPLLAVVSLGESHRAHHHRFPRSARLSPFEGGFDPGYMVARGLSRLGLASTRRGDLGSPAARRIPLPANRVVSVSGPAPVLLPPIRGSARLRFELDRWSTRQGAGTRWSRRLRSELLAYEVSGGVPLGPEAGERRWPRGSLAP